jgi:hypothetical protein
MLSITYLYRGQNYRVVVGAQDFLPPRESASDPTLTFFLNHRALTVHEDETDESLKLATLELPYNLNLGMILSKILYKFSAQALVLYFVDRRLKMRCF